MGWREGGKGKEGVSFVAWNNINGCEIFTERGGNDTLADERVITVFVFVSPALANAC